MSNSGHAARHGFRPDIQGLRALAVGLVLLYHARIDLLPGGYVGVDVFYVISGYLITGILAREFAASNRIALLPFYARRIRRLVPAAMVTLLATTLCAAWIYSPLELVDFSKAAIATALYSSNLWFAAVSTDYLAADATASPLLHTWSLGVEEQFYLVWPAVLGVLLASCSFPMRYRVTIIGLILLTVVSFVVCVLTTAYSQPWAFFGMPMRAWEFGAGALVALLPVQVAGLRATTCKLLQVFGLLLVAGAGCSMDDRTIFPGYAAVVPVTGATLMIFAGHVSRQSAHTIWLSNAPLRYVGDISYSLYLWHWPVIVFASELGLLESVTSRLAAVALCLLVASLSYHFIENPFRRGRGAADRPHTSLTLGVAVPCIVAVTSCALLVFSERRAAQEPYAGYAHAATDVPELYAMGCHAGMLAVEPRPCDFNPNGERTVVLFGDSHAAHWFPALIEGARDHNVRIRTYTKSSCPSVEVEPYNQLFGRPYSECTEWRGRVLDAIGTAKPSVVVLSNSLLSLGFDDLAIADRRRQWLAGLEGVLTHLSGTGARVVVIRDVPLPGFDVPRCLARQAKRGSSGSGPCMFLPDLGPHAPLAMAERRLVETFPNAIYVDLAGRICPDSPCQTERNGVVLFSDSHHLTATFSSLLAEDLYRAWSQ